MQLTGKDQTARLDGERSVRHPCAATAVLVAAFCLPAAAGPERQPLEGPAGLGAIERASAAPPKARRWIGTTQGTALRAGRWVSGGSSSRGDFWFTVGRGGRVRGEAVVAYTPTFDTDGLNALLAYARGLTQAALGGVPLFGGLGAAQLNAFVGVRIHFDEPLAIRRGQISGTLRGGRLSLRWAGARPAGIPFKAVLSTIRGDRPLTGGRLLVRQPFAGSAQVAGGGHAIATHHSEARDKGVTEQASSYWSAHRVGRR